MAMPHELPEEPALLYGLVHHATALEAVAQLEYEMSVRDAGTRVSRASAYVRVDNIRTHVVRHG